MNRKGRLGCGCLLIALGAPVAFVAYLYVGLAGIYGTDDWWQEPVIWIFLLAGLVAAVTGIVLMFGTPKQTDRIVVPRSPRLHRSREWWVDVIGAVVLWIIATVIAMEVFGLGDGTDAWIAGVVPLAFLLVRHLRRTRSKH